MTVEAEVTFEECPWQPEQEELNQLKHIVSQPVTLTGTLTGIWMSDCLLTICPY